MSMMARTLHCVDRPCQRLRSEGSVLLPVNDRRQGKGAGTGAVAPLGDRQNSLPVELLARRLDHLDVAGHSPGIREKLGSSPKSVITPEAGLRSHARWR